MKQEHKEIFEKYSIIQTGGKQYQAIEGKTIAIEKLDLPVGSDVTFNEVLFRKKGDNAFEFGKPYIANAPVKAVILKHMQGPKVIAFKFGRRKKIRTKKGHRQPLTIVRIASI